jgi:hypothetical protein
MKRTETIEVTRVYCDVCNELCESGHMTFIRDGAEQHACSAWDEKRGLTHWQILRDRIVYGHNDGLSGPSERSS